MVPLVGNIVPFALIFSTIGNEIGANMVLRLPTNGTTRETQIHDK